MKNLFEPFSLNNYLTGISKNSSYACPKIGQNHPPGYVPSLLSPNDHTPICFWNTLQPIPSVFPDIYPFIESCITSPENICYSEGLVSYQCWDPQQVTSLQL